MKNYINTYEYLDNSQNNSLYVDLRNKDIIKNLNKLIESFDFLDNTSNSNEIPRNFFQIASPEIYEKKLVDFLNPENNQYTIAEFAKSHSGKDSFLIIKNLLPYLEKSKIRGKITQNGGFLELPFDKNIEFNSDGKITQAKNTALIGKDIYHYLACNLSQDFASVLKKNGKLIYASDISRFEKTPKNENGKNAFLGKDFLEFHSKLPVIGEKLVEIFQKMSAKFADNSLNMLTADLYGRGKYLDKDGNLVRRFERDKFIPLKDKNENFAGFLGVADVFFQSMEEDRSPFDGGQYSKKIETQIDLLKQNALEIINKNIIDDLKSREILLEQKLQILGEILANPEKYQEEVFAKSAELNEKLFGRELELYGISYISDKCTNDCSYCGLSSKIKKKRRTLSKGEISRDFQNVLDNKHLTEFCVLSGENPKSIIDYENSLEVLNTLETPYLKRISLNIAPLSTADFKKLLQKKSRETPLQYRIFQESYDREIYAKYHTKGSKTDFDFRYDAQARALEAGFDEVGIGALMGLNTKPNGHDFEILELVKHAHELAEKSGKFPASVSIPRHMPVQDYDFETPNPVDDEKYIFYHALLRLALPESKLMITSRESAEMIKRIEPFVNIRDLAPKPGVGGNIQSNEENFQNEVTDNRSASEIIADLKKRGKLKNLL